MQGKESIMVMRCQLKIPSFEITVRHHFASLMMWNSYSHDGIFNLHLTTMKDSYILRTISRERYIPITRRSIIRYLVEQERFFSEEEKKKFEDFALALDSAIVNKYHGVLQELKVGF